MGIRHTTPAHTLLQATMVPTTLLHIRHEPECITAPPGTRDIMVAIGTGATGMRGTGAVTECVSTITGAAIMTGTIMPAGITATDTDTSPAGLV